ncbi:sterile alpha motif domain-containing protein 1 isoform X2 [Maylandia zebra]|uniref:Sterile alpha motif domain containing 1 n=2 Tax=Haplochromini TaxID=319058 RepID=A0A3Q2VP01_HAPBU|nr:atherin [Maylandia zebra]XP_005931434.1 atherin isoform X1 [Haplochromis burtoni]XP_026026054.1 atherin-like [Astatotilapia calliptera]
MSEPNKYREWILETIDSLRSRKARPDLERICRMVRRRHGSDPDRTRTELEKLIQEQTVLKVSYKGSISYRNAAKVQRKSRKKSEFTAAGSSSSSAEAARERTKHDHLNNNGDSAHSFTDQEEAEEDSEPSPDPHTQTSGSTTGKKLKPASSPSSGNGCLSCGATTGCAVGSGCKEEKASAPRDKGLGQQAAGDCPSPGFGHRTGAHSGADGGRTAQSKAGAVSAEKECAVSRADTQSKTCPGSVSSVHQNQRQKQSVPLKPKLRVGGGSTKTTGNHANSDLGDRLVASVRSLSEKSLRGGSATVTRGHMKPLGLKEILGYLSSQERLSEEKLTRGKVKVVMEREVARGRLRRTRCGNITLPLRGVVVEEPMPKNASADRLAKSALQDKHAVKKPPSPSLQENEPMETASEEEEREDNEEEEEEEDTRSSEEEGGLSPVAMTTEPVLIEKIREDAEIQKASKQESPQQEQQEGGKGLPVLDFIPDTPVQGASQSQSNGPVMEERAGSPDQIPMEVQVSNQTQHDEINHSSSDFNNLECKTEVGVSSCLLTPTASPRDSSRSEERGITISSGVLMKSEGVNGSPVNWTVSDVVSYFTAAGFPEQAAAFRTQEIDGKSLLLMQRNDVLTGLSIRLGPALKIYERHVKVLQKTHFEDDDC